MKTKLSLLAVLGILILPSIASATHLIELTGQGDCLGWNAQATVLWHNDDVVGSISYTVLLVDSEANVVETFTGEGALVRDGSSTQIFEYFDMWSVYADAGEYTIEGEFYFESVYGGGGGSANTLEFSNTFICDVVPVESHSWTSVKSLYR